METQNYKNHIRYYITHHFIFYPVVGTLTGVCIYMSFKEPDHHFVWMAMAIVFAVIGWLSYMLRQHYALTNQNRIARLELRFRYYVITHKRFEEIERQLSLGQILALRFASDEELEGLIQKAITEKLSPDAIKQSIKNWVPDYMRV